MSRKIEIREVMFMDAFSRDVDYHDQFSEVSYLDLDTGEMVWMFEEDHDAQMAGIGAEENSGIRARIEASPDRYLEVPGRDHGEHHDILRSFLRSRWTDNEDVRQHAWHAYSGSIGRWLEDVRSRDIVHCYFEYKDQYLKDLATEFLRDHGIEPVWR